MNGGLFNILVAKIHKKQGKISDFYNNLFTQG